MDPKNRLTYPTHLPPPILSVLGVPQKDVHVAEVILVVSLIGFPKAEGSVGLPLGVSVKAFQGRLAEEGRHILNVVRVPG